MVSLRDGWQERESQPKKPKIRTKSRTYYKADENLGTHHHHHHNFFSSLNGIARSHALFFLSSSSHGAFTASCNLQCDFSRHRDAASSSMSYRIQEFAGSHGTIPMENSRRRYQHYQYWKDLVKTSKTLDLEILTSSKGENRSRSPYHRSSRQSS